MTLGASINKPAEGPEVLSAGETEKIEAWPRLGLNWGMSITERLYHEFPDLDVCSARIVSLEEGNRILVLDRSVFFPEGGGQPCDLGTIDGIVLASVDVDRGQIRHVLASPLEQPPSRDVTLRLDRDRRRDNTEQHSAQHLLSGLFFRDLGVQTLSFHLGPERSTIDLGIDVARVDEAALDRIENSANRLIAEDRDFIVHRCPPEDYASFPLRKEAPAGEDEIRVIEIGGIDWSPCCGTHVTKAGKLRLVKIISIERYKGLSRLSFVAGGRAVAHYRILSRSAGEAARALSVPAEDLGPGARNIVEKLRMAQSASRAMLHGFSTSAIDRAMERGEKPLCLRFPGIGAGASADAAEDASRALVQRGLAGLVIAPDILTVVVVAPRGSEIRERLSPMAGAFGGRGGGGDSSFRAVLPDLEAMEGFAAKVCEALRVEP